MTLGHLPFKRLTRMKDIAVISRNTVYFAVQSGSNFSEAVNELCVSF